MSVSLLVLQEDCAREVGLYAEMAPSETSSATTSFVVDGVAAQVDENDADTLFRDCWVRVESDSAGTPLNVGAIRRIQSYTPATSTFTLAGDRGFANAPTATQTMGFFWTIPPDQIVRTLGWKQHINLVLQDMRYRRLGLLTSVTDGDMEASGTTNWTASNTTLSKVTAAATVGFGVRALRVLNSSANGYARSALIEVEPSDVWMIRADLNVETGTAHLVAYDETNGAEIESENTTAQDWRVLGFQCTIPSGSVSMSIRLKGAESSADVYWDNVVARHTAARQLALPSWLDEKRAFEGLLQTVGGHLHNDAMLRVSEELEPLMDAGLVEDPLGATAYRVRLLEIPRSEALVYVQGLSAYDALSATSDTTVADKRTVIAGACARALRAVKDDRWKQYAAEYLTRMSRLATRRRAFARPD